MGAARSRAGSIACRPRTDLWANGLVGSLAAIDGGAGEATTATTENTLCTTDNTHSAPFGELHQCLATRAPAISPFVDQLMRFIRLFMGRFGIAKDTEGEVEIAISEALANAVINGNHEDAAKHVDVICRCSMAGDVVIIVRDEGEGFDGGTVPGPTEPETLFLTSGRGLYLMRTLMDDVSFEKNGTVVRNRKRLGGR
jgi:serine/threonine-protein kinase RsbW